VSDIDTALMDSLKVLDPEGRLEKQTCRAITGMSQKCQQETHAPQQFNSLFDYLVGGREQRRRNGEAERIRSLEVDHEFKFD
jgi:hypothetical protein